MLNRLEGISGYADDHFLQWPFNRNEMKNLFIIEGKLAL